MFFIASKVLSFLSQPITWVFLLMLGALLLRKPTLKKRLLIGSFVVFYVFSNGFLFNLVNRAWEYPLRADQHLTHYEYGIVLGGFANWTEQTNRTRFYGNSGRLWHAVRLYHLGKIDKIFISGGSGSMVNDVREAEFVEQFLKDCNIPASDIRIEKQSRNTRENALFTAEEILDEVGNNPQLLITSAYHMQRSEACFQKVGFEVVPYPIGHDAGPSKYYFDHLFVPSVQTLWAWQILIHEWLGIITYKITGYV